MLEEYKKLFKEVNFLKNELLNEEITPNKKKNIEFNTKKIKTFAIFTIKIIRKSMYFS